MTTSFVQRWARESLRWLLYQRWGECAIPQSFGCGGLPKLNCTPPRPTARPSQSRPRSSCASQMDHHPISSNARAPSVCMTTRNPSDWMGRGPRLSPPSRASIDAIPGLQFQQFVPSVHTHQECVWMDGSVNTRQGHVTGQVRPKAYGEEQLYRSRGTVLRLRGCLVCSLQDVKCPGRSQKTSLPFEAVADGELHASRTAALEEHVLILLWGCRHLLQLPLHPLQEPSDRLQLVTLRGALSPYLTHLKCSDTGGGGSHRCVFCTPLL